MQSVAAALARLGDLAATPAVSRLAAAFEAAGHELALVGGPVRDAFLDRGTNDLDFTTNASPEQILAIVTPISEAQWDIGRQFGTIAAKIAGETVEITTYRTDSYVDGTRKPEVVFGTSLDEDLVRRDFTVNSIALRLPQMTLVDPSGGIEDILDGRLRTPAAPEQSFGDDPLRMMRAARFASQLGFELDAAAFTAMTAGAESIRRISIERVNDELSKLLKTDAPRAGLELLVDSGIAAIVLPELPALRLEIDEHHHHKDVYEHSLTVLEQAIGYEKSRGKLQSPDLILRLASLLHDIGKPATRRLEPGGVVSFHHHDYVGSKL
ncbi:MAG TPA: CCA tRNA nucleotidyltransferase, partial [Microterricola sp.]